MFNSIKANEMFSYISPIYEQSEIMKAIFEVVGLEIDFAYGLSDDVLLQLFPQTATWGLKFWEKATGVVTNANDALEIRRTLVINKLQNPNTITPFVFSKLISSFTTRECEIKENTNDYEFSVTIINPDAVVNFKRLIELINNTKPAHLSFELIIKYLKGITIGLNRSSYLTQPHYLCGTIDVNYNEYIATTGDSVNSDIENTFNNYASDVILRSSESTLAKG